MSVEPGGSGPDRAPWAGIRTIVVPPDIVPVRRTSPIRVKKRTPWRPRPDAEPTDRGGAREWFSDHIFAESQQPHLKAACSTSMTAHVSCLMVVVAVLLSRSFEPRLVKVGPPLVMPAMLAMVALPAAPPALSPAARSVARALPTPATPAPPPPPAAALPAGITAPAPIEAPSGIEPETGLEGGAGGVAGGVDGGVEGGTNGGIVGGVPGADLAPRNGSGGAVRLTAGMQPPRKIKDVRPLYPSGALSDQARGTVVIEAVVDVDGTVADAKVIQSVALLDQAALDAVRQWEFLPARVNGMAVAVIITIIVQFAIH